MFSVKFPTVTKTNINIIQINFPEDAVSWKYTTESGDSGWSGLIYKSANTTFRLMDGTYDTGTIGVKYYDTIGNESGIQRNTLSFVLYTVPFVGLFASFPIQQTEDNKISVTLPSNSAYWEYTYDYGSSWNMGYASSFTLPCGSYDPSYIKVRGRDAFGNSATITNQSKVTIILALPIPTCTTTGKKRNCSVGIISMDKTRSSMDKMNSSTTLLYAKMVKRGRSSRVYQGQPSSLQIKQVGLTTAHIFFQYVGTPLSYQIILTNVSGIKYYSVNHDAFASVGYYKVTGLVPNNVYEVNVIAYYVSGDTFPLNFSKSFETTNVEGPVRTIRFQNPTNLLYSFHTWPFATSFDIIFSPLNDIVNYEVLVKDAIMIPYDKTASEFKTNIRDVSFNFSYDISIFSIYGSPPDGYSFSASRTHTTLYENLTKCDLSLIYIYSTYVDFSYTKVEFPLIVYKLYLEDICVKTDTTYHGTFRLSGLQINTHYGNTYVSVTYPETGNEYKNRIKDISFTTLNEGNATIDNKIIRNTEIDISFSNIYGSTKTIEFYITDVVRNTSTRGLGSPFTTTESTNINNAGVFTNLTIDTEYKISIVTTYIETGHVYDDCNLILRTLNEGPIRNIQDTHPDINTTKIVFSPSPYTAGLETYEYSLFLIIDNIEIQTAGPIALSKDASFVLLPDLSADSYYRIEFESVYSATNHKYTSDITFLTINDVNEYNENSIVTTSNITGNSVILKLQEGSYYQIAHDISYSKFDENSLTYTNTFIKSAVWYPESGSFFYKINGIEKDTSYNIEVTSFITKDAVGYTHQPTLFIKTLNESAAEIYNIHISDTSAKITWKHNLDISYILINNKKAIDFSFTYDDLSMNTANNFIIETVYKTSNNTYISDITIKTLHEQAPVYFTNTYFDTYLSGDTITRIEVQNVNQPHVNNTVINIGDKSYSTLLLDVSMVDRYSGYSGNIVTTYNTTQPTGVFTYKTRSYISEFSFVTIMYKPKYTVYSDRINMKWYDVGQTVSSYSIYVTENGGTMSIINLNNTDSSYDITNLDIDTRYDISFVRLFGAITKTEFESIQTLNEGPA